MKKIAVILLIAVFMTSILTTVFVSAENDDGIDGAAKFLKQKFNINDVTKEFTKIKTQYDNIGYKHVKVQQIVNNIPVYGMEYIVHFDKSGNVYGNGKFSERARGFNGKSQYIKAKEALGIAKAEAGYAEETAEDEAMQPDKFETKLYLYEVNGEYIPVYLVRVNWFHSNSFGDWRIFVNAYNGDIVRKFNAIAYSDKMAGKPGGSGTTGTPATGVGTGVLGDTKTINLLLNSSVYYINDKSRTQMGGITTYTANNKTRLPGTIMSDSDTIWDSTVQRAAVDAHYYAGLTYDFYYNNYGRNSIDNNGMAIKSTVHYSRDYVNAFWNGSQMVYGDGDGVEAVELSGGLDVVAHELTHGVTSYEADLEYSGQSGALNESFSDVLATAIEFTCQPDKADWLIGEDIWTPAVDGDALRSLEDPTLYGDPDCMDAYVDLPNTSSGDYGGVHTNSLIPSKAAYLIGSALGTDKMADMYYRALCYYLTITSDFSDCRAAILQCAADFYGANSIEYSTVGSAFDAVGIY